MRALIAMFLGAGMLGAQSAPPPKPPITAPRVVAPSGIAPPAPASPAAINRCLGKSSPDDISCLRALAAASPADAAVHKALGGHLLQGDPPAAEKEFRTAMRLAPSNPAYGAALLNFLVDAESFEKAATEAEQMKTRWPKSALIAAARGRLLIRRQDFVQARAEYMRAASLDQAGGHMKAFIGELQARGYNDQVLLALRLQTASIDSRAEDHLALADALASARLWKEAVDEYVAADQGSVFGTHAQDFASRLATQGEKAAAAEVYLRMAGPAGFRSGDPVAASRAIALLEETGNWTRLNSACADSARGGLVVGNSLPFACQEAIGELASRDVGSEAMGLYRAMRGNGASLFTVADKLIAARMKAGAYNDIAEICEANGFFTTPECGRNIDQSLAMPDLQPAMALYNAMKAKSNPFSQPSFGALADFRDNLGLALARQSRVSDAVAVCSAYNASGCDKIIEALFKSGHRDEAVAVYVGNSQKMGGSMVDFHTSALTAEDLAALNVAKARMSNNLYDLKNFLNSAMLDGKIEAAAAEIRRSGPDLDFGQASQSLLTGDAAVAELIRRGVLSAKVNGSTPMYDRFCKPGANANYGETFRIVYTGTANCKVPYVFDEVFVEQRGRVWGVPINLVTLVVAGADAPPQPRVSGVFEEVLARMSGSIGNVEVLDEVTLGIAAEKDVTSKHEIYLDSKATAAGTTAFRELMATSYARSGGVPAFQLLLLKDDTVNAFSTAGGRVFVNRGMLPLVGEDHGLWAAVIAHEVGHVVAHHQYKHYMRTIELKLLQEGLAREAATGNKVAQWAWIFSKTGGPLLNMKFSRNEENEADRLGLMMMAEAGYHPAYVLELMDRVKKVTGEKGKVGTFLSSDHPRWESREKKVKDSFDEALRIFNAKWPEPASSPGGAPPR